MHQSKCCARLLRRATYPASLAGPIAVRSTQFGAGEQVVFAGDMVPKTLELFLKQSTKHTVDVEKRDTYPGDTPEFAG